tara:strand:+ start:84 stop:365 length:282 start_codon:yes stop_codon:yes gene_type:complete
MMREFGIAPTTLIPNDFAVGMETHSLSFLKAGGTTTKTGEWIAIEQMKVAVDVFVNRCEYVVPEQVLKIEMDRLPAIPQSHFILQNIRIGKHA